MSSLPRFNPYDPAFLADPYPVYSRYRDSEPVHWGLPQDPRADGCFYLFRAREIEQMLKDNRFRRRAPGPPEDLSRTSDEERPFMEMSRRWLLSSDPPDHTRLRKLVDRAFTARRVEGLRERIQALASQLIQSALPQRQMELVNDFAFPLSFTVIAEILGVRAEDLDGFRRWSNDVGEGINFRTAGSDALARASRGTVALSDYFKRALRGRLGGSDVLSTLVEARDEGNRIDDDELIAMCVQLIFAGQETTVNQIGNAVLALLGHPERLERLRRRPELMNQAVPELMRFDAAVQTAAARRAAEDVMVGDTMIPAGAPVIAILGAANRDPELFERPDELDIERPPSRSFAFGHGIHYCLGASLARLELEIALGTLLDHCAEIRLANRDVLEYREHVVLRGVTRLDLVFEEAGR